MRQSNCNIKLAVYDDNESYLGKELNKLIEQNVNQEGFIESMYEVASKRLCKICWTLGFDHIWASSDVTLVITKSTQREVWFIGFNFHRWEWPDFLLGLSGDDGGVYPFDNMPFWAQKKIMKVLLKRLSKVRKGGKLMSQSEKPKQRDNTPVIDVVFEYIEEMGGEEYLKKLDKINERYSEEDDELFFGKE